MIDWPVGSQIVCIDDGHINPPPGVSFFRGLDGLTKGDVYTVAGFYIHGRCGLAVIVDEIQRPRRGGVNCYPGYLVSRFRPVKKTSIDVFTRMLTNIPADLECV